MSAGASWEPLADRDLFFPAWAWALAPAAVRVPAPVLSVGLDLLADRVRSVDQVLLAGPAQLAGQVRMEVS